MYLLTDIGNQNVKWSVGDENGIFPSSLTDFDDNFSRQFEALDQVTHALFVNVTGHDTAQRFCSLVRSTWGIQADEAIPESERCGVRNCYRQARQLGPDRWVAAIGAWHITRTATIIVDCGTAITVDALSSAGEFLGGSILPGIRLAQESLHRRARGIEEVPVLTPSIPARSTIEAVSSGVLSSAVGGIELLIDRYSELTGPASRLLITGGDATLVQQHSDRAFEHIPDLVLQGLSRIAETTD